MDKTVSKVYKTKDIKGSLSSFSQQYKIALEECDYSIVSTDTYMKDASTHEYVLLQKEQIKAYLDKERIINEHISFEQIHTIKIFQLKTCSIKLDYTINYGTHSTHPKIILSPKSIIPYKRFPAKEILHLIYKELNKIKIYHGILINIFDMEMKQKLKAFIKHLYAGKFKKRIQILLFDGIEPVITRESKLVFWFKEKNVNSQVIEVEEDEVLVEFKKPIYGKNGFNAFGEELSTKAGNNRSDLEVEIDPQTIEIQEDERSKLYKSKRKGFVHFDKRKLFIDNRIKVAKISRNNTALASEEENNIEVSISQNDTTQDSIGEGVELVSETINVNGFVGAGSKLEAIHLNIEGATHQDSLQFAKTAKINRHKGTLRCSEARIGLLEGGEVHATSAHIETCLGGTIYAKDVTITHVKSNLKVFASHSITIKLVSGEDNIFNINYKKIPILLSYIQFIKEDIEDLKYHLEEAQRHDPTKEAEIQNKITDLQNSIKNIKESYKTAKISVEKPFRGLNKIIFTIDEENELLYKTDEKEYNPFYLEIKDDKIILEPVGLALSLKEQ
jgi:hypothetical protein